MKTWMDITILAAEAPPATEHAPFNVWTTLPLVLVIAVLGWWAVRRFRLPFVGRVFWWTLPATYLVAALIWGGVIAFSDYKTMPADYGGTIISSAILAYLIHLWLIPVDELPGVESESSPGSHTDSDARR